MNADTFTILIRDELLKARKQRDELIVRTLSPILNAIDNASAVDVPLDVKVTEVARRELTIEDIQSILVGEIEEAERALELYRLSNIAEMANEMALQVEMLRQLLGRIQ